MTLEPITHAPIAVQIHLVTALAALVFGTLMWIRPKGTRSHKLMGRLFVMMMVTTAFSAIFIRLINRGQFSFIHLFVPLTFYASIECIWAIRNGKIKKHVKSVKGLYFGALFIPAFFSFMPGRIMHMMFFGG